MDVVYGVGPQWVWLIETFLLALLAVGFFVAAQRFYDKRFSWLLSGSVAVGLAVADFYRFINAVAAPAISAAGFVVVIVLCLVRRVTRQRPRR